MQFHPGDRVKLDARAFPKLAHVTFEVVETPTHPADQVMQWEMTRVQALNARATKNRDTNRLVFVHVEGKPAKWRTVWTAHLVPADAELDTLVQLGRFSTEVLQQFAELALRTKDIDLHAQLVAEIQRRG